MRWAKWVFRFAGGPGRGHGGGSDSPAEPSGLCNVRRFAAVGQGRPDCLLWTPAGRSAVLRIPWIRTPLPGGLKEEHLICFLGSLR